MRPSYKWRKGMDNGEERGLPALTTGANWDRYIYVVSFVLCDAVACCVIPLHIVGGVPRTCVSEIKTGGNPTGV